jgi:histidine triad (HIT) family protein
MSSTGSGAARPHGASQPTAAPGASAGCVFCRIAAGSIPCTEVYADELVLAFRDLRPQAPSHVLVIPRAHLDSLHELEDRRLAGALLVAAAEVARRERLDAGWRLIANSREHGGQEVRHLHLHVVGGKKLGRMLPP